MRSRFWFRLLLAIGCVGGLAPMAWAEAPHLEVSTTTIEIVPLPDRPIHTDAELGVMRVQLAEMMRLSPQTTIKVVAPAPKPTPAVTPTATPPSDEDVAVAEEPEEPEEEEAAEDADTQ
jgi:hypothetical protein